MKRLRVSSFSIGFALPVLFLAFYVIPRLRKGRERTFDSFAFLNSFT
jgi:hypothetical protein